MFCLGMDFMKKIYVALLCFSISFSLDAGIDTWQKNRKAVELYRAQKYEQALELYNELIVNDPYNAVYNYNIAEILYRQNQYEQAAQSYKRVPMYALKKKQLAEYAWYGAGNSFYQLKQWQNAIEMYEQALKIDPENEQTRHNLWLAQQELAKEQYEDQQDDSNSSGDESNGTKDQSKQDQNSKNSKKENSSDKAKWKDDHELNKGSSPSEESSSSEKQSSGDDEDSDNDSSEAFEKGKSSQEKNSDAGDEKQNESSESQGQQDDVDSQGEKSSDEKKSHQEKNGKREERDQLDEENASAEKTDNGTSQKGQDKDVLQDAQEKNLDEKLQEHQQKLDDVAAHVEENITPSQNEQAGLEENSNNLEHEQSKENASSQSEDLQDSTQNSELKKPASTGSQKQSLKNDLQELYESKSSEDDRFNSHYAEIMQALENHEEQIQRYVIKNKVAEKMVGQHGKKGW
ncbi:hypothetical protein C0J27_04405 [Candidatus Chromulinivorax destructor]|uniref:Tetratricopeptide repeat protein n=2 Tax=Candidatus Chromulinivorax destructor TaxID=2066483 RepID=A0A345ZCD2_9BACT|nr:hypothetical protein C0J27_04405 [Candidatus Chromulinivorax destructor]